MKSLPIVSSALLFAAVLAGLPANSFAQSEDEIIEAARSTIKADRQAVVTESMQFSEVEAKSFWPLYHQYRAEMDTVGDGVKHLVLEYAGLYPNVPDDRAKRMLKELGDLEKKQVATRARHLKKFAKALPAAKTLRFAQVESRLDLAVRLELAASIPLVPITGEIAGRLAAGAAFVEGTAGGVFVQTREVTAKVAAIDQAKRKVTLVSEDGIKQVVKVGPEAINFDQIRVGDQLTVTATEELAVEMSTPGDTTEAAALVTLAPKGAKPGGVIAEAVQVTGTITAIDAGKRTATLKFEDGTTKTFPVRRDVDLSQRKAGDKVTFRVTEVMAIQVKKSN
jgi:Cu/Ag efflux protein CusF